MKRSALEPNYEDLPAEIPIFPLNGALLLPGGKLPLNIFESRYLSMVADALADHRLIGMIQTNQESSDAGINPPLYTTGCLGRLSSFEETSDGRFLITLSGVIRFRVVEELSIKSGYRRICADYSSFASDLQVQEPVIDRSRLLRVLKQYFSFKGFTADWDSIQNCETERLVTTLAMICPFSVGEKQALLEALSTPIRAEMMSTMLEMAVSSHEFGQQDEGNVRH